MDDIIKAAKAVCLMHNECGGLLPGHTRSEWVENLKNIRSALAAHEAAPPTVAVPVEALRQARQALRTFENERGGATRTCAACGGYTDHKPSCLVVLIDALLPPREPPRELVAEWERRGEDYADSYPFSDTWDNLHRDSVIHAVRDTLRALWAADPKNGGAT